AVRVAPAARESKYTSGERGKHRRKRMELHLPHSYDTGGARQRAPFAERRPFRRRDGCSRDYLYAPPGSAIRRCCSLRAEAGRTCEIAARSLFCQPVTTSPSPRIIAAKPVSATSSGVCFFPWA